MAQYKRFLIALGCLCIITGGHGAALTTPETLVVSRSDDTTPDSKLEEPSSTTAPVTDGPTPPLKLTEMDVKSVITMRYAHTAVIAHVTNPAKVSQEANFRVILPETAFISGFVMTLGDKSYKAYVKEKDEAKKIYQNAVSQGIGAAHVAAKARDSNHFELTMNIEPSSKAVFNLTYEELLTRRNGVYNHAVNLHPGSLVPKFSVTIDIKESAEISVLRVPEIRTGNEIDASKDDPQNPNAVIKKEGSSATITFTPDLEEQRRLISVYAEKSQQSALGEKGGVLGQFVVQYDVMRPKDGDVLVNDGYFVHFFAPEELPPLLKHVVFVLDTSGSMSGRKIEQLRQAMLTILSELNPGDYFNIISFESRVRIHSIAEADKEPPKRHYYENYSPEEMSLKPAIKATPENIEKAKVIVSRLDAYGGTNIYSALTQAVELINKRSELANPTPATGNATETTTSTTSTIAVAEKAEGDKGVAALEPIIIFLTDGDPTVGETNPKTIINHLVEKNYGQNKATIFSLAFGEDADRKFLRKVSLRNDGFMRHIYEAADAALQLRDFYRQVSSPLLADVKFIYPPNQVNEEGLTRRNFRAYYHGSEVVVAGRVQPNTQTLEPQVLGFCGVVDDPAVRKKFDKKLKVPVPVEKRENLPLERLWAYLTIKQLLDESDASDASEEDKKKEGMPQKKALDLALKYEFVTQLTSLVVVKPNDTKAVDAESVDAQREEYSRPLALGAPLFSAPSLPGSSGFAAVSSFAGTQMHSGYPPMPSSGMQSIHFGYQPMSFSQPSSYWPSSGHHHRIAAFHSYSRGRPAGNYADKLSGAGIRTTPATVYLTTPAPYLPLHIFHLQDLTWAKPLVDPHNETLTLQDGNKTVSLKLTRDSEAPKSQDGDKECSNAVEGDAGFCVYLTRCRSARRITAETYIQKYCNVNGFAGVCCKKDDVDVPGN